MRPAPNTFVDLLEERVASMPGRHAYTFLIDGECDARHLTYRDLDRQAREIAARLQDIGTVGERAVLLYPPGLDYIAAFFGCLYAGVIPVPAYPPRRRRTLPRLKAMLADARPTVSLMTSQIEASLHRLSIQDEEFRRIQPRHCLVTDRLVGEAAGTWKKPPLGHASLAFLQYTSGSTGTPKGVMVTHGNLLHNQRQIRQAFGHTEETIVVGWLPLYHDMGLIGNVLQPVYLGVPCILMAPHHFLQKPSRWLDAISRYHGTTSGGPNFAYDLCMREITPQQEATLDLSSWTVAFNGAEPVRAATLERFSARFAPCGFQRRAFYPCYGLAEATLFVAGGIARQSPIVEMVQKSALEQHRVLDVEADTEHGQALVGCGQAWGGQEVRIVDPLTLEPAPDGRVGEIWVQGPSVTQGYWDRSEETAQTFHGSIASSGKGPYLRTGDLGVFKNGTLFVTGRLKDLIIIRGRNHYPQDIELTVEQTDPALRAGGAAVFAVECDDEERLVVVQELEPRASVRVDQLAAAIRQAVAEQHELHVYAVVLITAGSLPKTSSGKVQRHLVRTAFLTGTLDIVGQSRTGEAAAQTAFVGPETPVEQVVAEIWTDVFGRERVGRHDNFLALGGDSLRATQVAARVRQIFQIELPVERVFESPTVAELAECLTGLGAASRDEVLPQALPIERVERGIPQPLSFAQQRLWFLAQLDPGGASYNIPVAVRLTGGLDLAALERGLTELVRRHEVLRTTFPMVEGQPVQMIGPAEPIHLAMVDLGAVPEPERDASIVRLATAEGQRPFDLMKGPLIRSTVLRLAEQDHVLLLTLHHIVADGWSMKILAQELAQLYAAARKGRPVSLPPLPMQYVDYAQWQRHWLHGPVRNGHLAYWRARLAGAPAVLELPTDRPRPAIQTSRGAQHVFLLPAALAEELSSLSREHGVTLFMTLLAGFCVLLHRYTGQADVCVGAPIANRPRVELEGLIGFFVNTLVLRTDLRGNPSMTEVLARVREVVLGAQAHQDLPFEQLVEALQPVRELSHSPLFQVMFTLQPPIHVELNGVEARLLKMDSGTAKFDLSLDITPQPDGLAGILEYSTDLFDAGTIERMAEHLVTLLNGVVMNPAAHVSELPLMTVAEERQLLDRWRVTQVPIESGRGIHELFEAQVERRSEEVAVVWKEQALTYGELNDRATELAHELTGRGIGPGCLVGLCLARSLESIVAVLGVLKSGAAYVPLDPTYPKDRLEYMLRDAGLQMLLTQSRLVGDLPPCAAQILCLDEDANHLPSSRVAASRKLAPDDLAYVIYTSGSTGRPKGVMVTHGALVNAFHAWEQAYHLGSAATCHLQMANFAFDVFTGDWVRALCSGGRLVLCPSEFLFAPEQLFEVLTREGVTHAEFVPAVAKQLTQYLERSGQRLQCVRVLVVGSDAWELKDYCALRALCGSATRILNSYGVTEATIDSAFWEPPSHDVLPAERQLPIGFAMANAQLYIVDSFGQPVPTGVPGELCIGGHGLARGYWNRPELTAEKFVPNPFCPRPGARLYRTGDRARLRPDGAVELLGRLDHQIKLRGFRIEPGEIEALLLEHHAVREGVVLAREHGPGEKRLVAYIVPREGEEPTSTELRAHLSASLPEYMLPSAFVMLEALPLTPHGKVDRRALPVPDPACHRATEYVAPRTQVEETITRVWAAVLGLERVGIHENFFDLGGHSLLLSKVWSDLRDALGCEISMMDLFRYPTVSALARHLSGDEIRVEGTTVPTRQADPRRAGQRRLRQLSERRQAAMAPRGEEA